MKKTILTLMLGIIVLSSISQPPQAFKYQAIVRNNSGEILQNQPVGIRISIHDVSAGGTLVYQETFSETTNQFGLVNLAIGNGSTTFGIFFNIVWGTDKKYLEIEIDDGGGYVSMGTSELLSVPYAMHATSTTHGDNLGDHTATQNIDLNDHFLSGNGGVSIDESTSDGVVVKLAGSPPNQVMGAGANGFEVQGAEANGLFVGYGLTGVTVNESAFYGVNILHAGIDGVRIVTAGNPSTQQISTEKNGFEVAGAEGFGLFVGHADKDGINIHSSGEDGISVYNSGMDGLNIHNPVDDGLQINNPGNNGIAIHDANNAGVYIDTPAGHGISIGNAGNKGVNIANPAEDGIYVYNAGNDGISINNSNDNGIEINNPVEDGVYIKNGNDDGICIENTVNNGIYVVDAGQIGAFINNSGGAGALIANSGAAGLVVANSGNIGVYVDDASEEGIKVNTLQSSHEWGVYTPDKIYAMNVTSKGNSTYAKNYGNSALEAGDIVCIAGGVEENVLDDLEYPVVYVVKADKGNSQAVFGVVEYKVSICEKQEEAGEGQPPELRKSLRYEEGNVLPGEYMSVIVFGMADVKVDPGDDVYSGESLTSGDGVARKVKIAEIAGITIAENTGILGKALEDSHGKVKIKVFVNCK